MEKHQIQKNVAIAKLRFAKASRLHTSAEILLKVARTECKHEEKDSWTNNDGDGQFKVERCRICGLQQDGGLR